MRGSTGLAWNDEMNLHACPFDDDYIEKPQRLTKIKERMQFYGLWDRCRVHSILNGILLWYIYDFTNSDVSRGQHRHGDTTKYKMLEGDYK